MKTKGGGCFEFYVNTMNMYNCIYTLVYTVQLEVPCTLYSVQHLGAVDFHFILYFLEISFSFIPEFFLTHSLLDIF